MGLAERRKALGYSQEKFAHALGVDRTTVGRWERRETQPAPEQRPGIARVLGMGLSELDALLTPPQADRPESAASPMNPPHGPGEIDDMIRREFLRLLAVTGALTALEADTADAIAESADRGSVDDFHSMNGHLWQVYQLARSKRSVSAVVQDQLVALNDALKSSPSRYTDSLCTAASDLFQLAGELAFDENRYMDAAAAYTLAASASTQARSFDLWACALVRQSYVDLYAHRFAEAADTLEVARRVAARGDSSLSTRYWVASVQAEAFANLGNLDACERALDEAQEVAHLPTPAHNAGWLRFDGSRLSEERGARYVQLGRLDLAEDALKRALGSGALKSGMSFRRRGVVLADLAAIGAKRRDAEQVVTYGSEALRLARQSGSGYVARRLQTLRADLGTLGQDRRVAELDAEIGVLCTT
ncbi:helix-turn-helix transcriptional regulator [Streptomyces sp. NPDC004528]|uniref:helix-turn-helix transcriptional regulator n=1 Tax=Streptomyces sp. NPDC004528 TaxID=3154550 RepID=UPI0033AA3FE2